MKNDRLLIGYGILVVLFLVILHQPSALVKAAMKKLFDNIAQIGYPFKTYHEIGRGFGWRIHPVFHTPDYHTGIDIGATKDTPLLSMVDGKVVKTWFDKRGGNSIRIATISGDLVNYTFGYCHLDKYAVTAGQSVKKGQVIGYVGKTGTATGYHLHLTIRFYGVPVNPKPLLDELAKGF